MINRKAGVQTNVNNVSPYLSFYSLKAVLVNGTDFDFSTLKGRKVLLVNVASDCGYTPQYAELEKLFQSYKQNLVILAFPANDFKGQEPGNEKEIDEFCKKNYAVSFSLFQKHSVLEPDQHEVFRWLSHKNKNGWNDLPPSWNFCKYLVDENGRLQYFFAPYISPLSDEIVKAVNSSPQG